MQINDQRDLTEGTIPTNIILTLAKTVLRLAVEDRPFEVA